MRARFRVVANLLTFICQPQKAWTATKQFALPTSGYGGSGSGSTPCAAAVPNTIVYSDRLYVAAAASSSWSDISWGVNGKVYINASVLLSVICCFVFSGC